LHRHVTRLLTIGIAALAAGCTAGNGALEPPFTSVDLTKDKLQLAVGVATFVDGTKGLNAVATFRQPNGFSGTLLNTPTLMGPFTVPAAAPGAGVDAGTQHITGSPQAIPGGAPAVKSTFGQSGGVFAYGFAPENSTTAGTANYALYVQPFYDPTGALAGNPVDPNGNSLEYRGGPPAYPNVRDGTFDPAFFGYTLGFTTFALTPIVGTYGLSVNVPSGNAPSVTLTAPNATLGNAIGLPAFAAPPAFTPDNLGGGTATCTPPAGVTETLVEIVDTTVPAYYTFVAPGGGPVTVTLGDNLGPAKTGTTAPSIGTGDAYEVECIGADYPLFEAGPPANLQLAPVLLGAAGQADITFAVPITSPAYGSVLPASARHRAMSRVRRWQ